jgi:VanZ family protein
MKNLFQANLIWIALIVTLSIGYLSLVKTAEIPSVNILHIDKIYHLIAYFILAITWLLWLKTKQKKDKYFVILACIIYGIIIEVLQEKLTMYRTGDVFDFLANSSGIVLALLVFNLKIEKKQFN